MQHPKITRQFENLPMSSPLAPCKAIMRMLHSCGHGKINPSVPQPHSPSAEHSSIPSRDSQLWAAQPGQGEAAQSSELFPVPPQARCLQPELDAFLNQLTLKTLWISAPTRKNHCSWGGCLFKASCLLISVLNYLQCRLKDESSSPHTIPMAFGSWFQGGWNLKRGAPRLAFCRYFELT